MLALALALLAAPGQDTTVAVQRGQRLEISAQTGEIVVHTWPRSAIRIQASGGNLGRLRIDQSATAVSVRASAAGAGPARVAFDVTVPAWMSLRLSGVNTTVRVTGTDAAITVETVHGDVEVTGGNELVSLRSVEGSVTLAGARGKLDVGSVNSDVTVRDASGDLQAETVNGAVLLEKVRSDNVEANTVNGDVVYDGTIRPNGRYRFVTHNGDVAIAIPEGTSALVSVSTFQGDFESAFPVTLTERHGKRFDFTLGGGSARIDLESFGGTIRLVRPGALPGSRPEGSGRQEHPEDRD